MMKRLACLVAVALMITVPCRGGELRRYTDPDQQTKIYFGARSHWAQPWRAYLETVPATTLLHGTGINYSLQGDPDLRVRHLARHGISRVRLEIGWGSVNYDDETRLNSADGLRPVLQACKRYGVRPLILLNAHQGVPCPVKFFERTLTAAAHKGDRQVTLDSTDGLILGRSGPSNLREGDYWAAQALVTAINGKTVTLSKPLPQDIPAGKRVPMATLKYRPFSAPSSGDYQATVAGWLRYVDTVGGFARASLGTAGAADAGFDLEVWNELTFGDEFLYINHYYDPPPVHYDENSIWGNLVRETAAHVEAHRDRFPGVGIGDGFANTIPWPASSQEPAGVTAIDKHPYAGRHTFPDSQSKGDTFNALLQRDTSGWQPTYTTLFPEYFAAALQTETITREMSPLTTDIYGVKHGRYARTAPVSTWITEVNIGPDENIKDVDAATARYLKGKTTARYFAFFLNKGVTLMTLYNDADGGDRGLALESDAFLSYAKRPNAAYPADDSALTSPVLRVIGNIAAKMRPGLDPTLTLQTTRRITLDRIADTHDHAQFAGDGTAAHPPLHDRDVFAFLPFQVNARTFVIPYYVMTRDVYRVYNPSATGGYQYDMPAEDFTLTVGGLHGRRASVTAYDPLNDRRVAVKKLGGDARTLAVRVPAVDYPYLLIVRER
ncbi:MAG: hypothetical protein JO250_23080 [Armatimonadetes bacterium]|nr:hypothetical protein [Armatimonadota bacterium]